MTAGSSCRSCSAPVRWAVTVPNGRSVPLNVEPVLATERGALLVVPQGGALFAYSLKELAGRVAAKRDLSYDRAAEVVAVEFDAHLSHFATCPNANDHRSR